MSDVTDFDEDDLKRRMSGAFESLKKELSGLRSGRASTALLEPIKVDAYGSLTPISQVGTISVPEPRMISVQIWDKTMVAAVDKAIRNSPLGLNPVMDGQMLRIPIPPLNEERRAEIAKLAGTYSENARVAVRNVRRDGMDGLKRLEKDSVISEDEHKSFASDVQKMTDDTIKRIDDILKAKQEEIMQV
ncbi:MAG: ribosome recycling factor [Maricaulis sp.]|jgi:ribosome recycling factor|nr:ribosome recycling factor [Maricaulis sp.]MDG2044813.1 ribosome recycling factor [Maricaulis sp.]